MLCMTQRIKVRKDSKHTPQDSRFSRGLGEVGR